VDKIVQNLKLQKTFSSKNTMYWSDNLELRCYFFIFCFDSHFI